MYQTCKGSAYLCYRLICSCQLKGPRRKFQLSPFGDPRLISVHCIKLLVQRTMHQLFPFFTNVNKASNHLPKPICKSFWLRECDVCHLYLEILVFKGLKSSHDLLKILHKFLPCDCFTPHHRLFFSIWKHINKLSNKLAKSMLMSYYLYCTYAIVRRVYGLNDWCISETLYTIPYIWEEVEKSWIPRENFFM